MQETNQQEETTPTNPDIPTNPEAQEPTKPNYSKEDYELIFKGIRPAHMPQEDYKFLRSAEKRITRDYMRGSFTHVSQGFVVKDENGKKEIVHTKKGRTYIKDKSDGVD